ncbi:MAG: DUF1800 family protein [Verrucomicrobiae bacterium]|nr:DUF1800 family protein [Verrucomicrobiae bacterium]
MNSLLCRTVMVLSLLLIPAGPAASLPPADPFLDPVPPRLSLHPGPEAWRIEWTPYPHAETYRLLRAPAVVGPYVAETDRIEGLDWPVPVGGAMEFYQVEAVPLSPASLLTSIALSRLAYGPTPSELDRVRAIGPEAYLAEQLSPESIPEDLPHDRRTPSADWQFVTTTGTGSSSTLYIYLIASGEGYLDDLQLVAGTEPGAGPNLIRNGDFEEPLSGEDWVVGANHAASERTAAVRRSGQYALHLRASSPGSTRASAIVQTLTPSLSSSRSYTLSYWWRPSESRPAPLVIRLSGSGIVSQPGTLRDRLSEGSADLADLRAWHTLNAIHARRQLLQILLQFFDNHFVTQHSKSARYLDAYHSGGAEEYLATELEFRELERWRQVLLRPDGTFRELLTLSAESPAMILYLDTVNNRGGNGRIANENYARELLELFTFGADNGYDQWDIEQMARVWTGWSVRYVRPDQAANPFAPLSDLRRPGAAPNATRPNDLIGTWSLVFKDYNHDTGPKHLFYLVPPSGDPADPGVPRTYPARFGPQLAGLPYALTVPGLRGTNGIREGYQVLNHLADQPFTQEYLSVKLCRLFVHDDFHHGHYDYSAPDLSPEAALVKACMDAWAATEPKGQIRHVLTTLFASDPFRRHGAAQQKVKTPFEFAVSAVRALMTDPSQGAPATLVDPAALHDLMDRAGAMELFDRTDPDGYPESGPPWISAGTLAERIRFAQALLMPVASGYSARTGEVGFSLVHPLALVEQRLPAELRADSHAVADLFLGLLFPAEGRANLAFYRDLAVRFLDTSNDGVRSDPFARLATTGAPSPYEIRLRGMVALLLSLPLIHEQ